MLCVLEIIQGGHKLNHGFKWYFKSVAATEPNFGEDKKKPFYSVLGILKTGLSIVQWFIYLSSINSTV